MKVIQFPESTVPQDTTPTPGDLRDLSELRDLLSALRNDPSRLVIGLVDDQPTLLRPSRYRPSSEFIELLA